MKRIPADLILVVSLVYAAGMALICLLATMASADALDDYQRDQDRRDAQLERQRDAYEERAEEGRRQFERMEAEQERMEQDAYRQEERNRGN